MSLMLDTFEFGSDDTGHAPGPYPKAFVVEGFRGYRPIGSDRASSQSGT